MRKLAIILVVLCLGLSGCNVLHEVSHYFAGVEDFVRGNRKPTTPAEQKDSQEDTDEDTDEGGDDGTGESHALAAVCFRHSVDDILVCAAEEGTPGDLVLDAGRGLTPDQGTRFCEMGTLQDGDYFLELPDVDVGFTVAGSDLTLMLAINDSEQRREVRAVPLPGLIAAGPCQGE